MRVHVRTLLQPIAIAVVLALLLRTAMQIYAVPTESMAPALRAGDRIVATRYFRERPAAGDVIVFASPDGGDVMLVKRVVAVPGDLVDSRLGRLRVGGHTVIEPYASEPAATGEIAAMIVPADSYFVLGDNRRDSRDSRTFGVVPRRAIAGRARLILWSSRAAEAQRDARRGTRLFKWIE